MSATVETPSPAYLWFDTEFSDLNTSTAHLLQVALVITDRNLKRLLPPTEDVCACIRLDPAASLSPWVTEHLAELLSRCRSPEAVSLEEADAKLAAAVDAALGRTPQDMDDRPILAGNSVYMDLALAKRLLPSFAARLHYRLLDVSALKVLRTDWDMGATFEKESRPTVTAALPAGFAIPPTSEHDALYDVVASIAELNAYRTMFRGATPAP